MSFMNNFQLYGKLEELSAKNVQNLDLINSSILVAILDDSSPETDADLIKVVLGGSGNFGLQDALLALFENRILVL